MSELKSKPPLSEAISVPQRRLILPQKQTAVQSSISIVPDVPALLNDALSIIAMEIVNLKSRTGPGKSLDLAEARVLTGYLKALTEMARELREREEDPSKLSTDQIVELLQRAANIPKEEPPHGT